MPVTRLVFFNPSSGSAWIAERTLRAVEVLARVPGTQVHGTVPGSVAEQVSTHLSPQVERVYAIGGDGTVGDVASALVGTSAALGIIPAGTTNVLAREYGIPMNTRRAVEVLERSTRTANLHTWRIGEHTAVLGAGVGWDARVMWNAPSWLKRRFGRTGIGAMGFIETMRYEFPRLTVTGTNDRGVQESLHGCQVILATVKRWAGGNTGIPQADPGDKYIDVVVVDTKSRFLMLTFWTLMTLPGGRPLHLPGVRTARFLDARVTSDDGRAIEAHVNGEGGLIRSPIEMVPAGDVKVIVPHG
jgi:diacylglycerol kinase family enzyme